MSAAEVDRLIEHAVLTMVLDRHPEHLTDDELVLEMVTADQAQSDDAIRRAISSLIGSGVLRRQTDVLEPTNAAVRTADVLDHHRAHL